MKIRNLTFYLGILLLTFLPNNVFANVFISEIAWMGSAESANHEWIELHNSGPAIDVSGWYLYDENNIDVELIGVIPENAYVVLERTSDASAQGTAFLTYTGALSNSGATLTLKNGAEVVVDQVASGANWESVGGDNVTKETGQRSAFGGVWVTAVATPGAPASGGSVDQDSGDDESKDDIDNEETQSSVEIPPQKSKRTEPMVLPGNTLGLAIYGPNVVQVHQPVTLSVDPYGVGRTIAASVEYVWNMGDGSTKLGEEVSHYFSYPGTYVVVVEGEYKRQQARERIEIEVIAPQLDLRIIDTVVEITNISSQEVLLEDYRLVGNRELVLPVNTILLPSQAIRIPVTQIADTQHMMLALYDQADSPVATLLPDVRMPRYGEVTKPIATQIVPTTQNYISTSKQVTKTNESIEAISNTLPAASINYENNDKEYDAATLGDEENVNDPSHSEINRPLYGFIVLLLVGIVAVLIVPQTKTALVKDAPPLPKW